MKMQEGGGGMLKEYNFKGLRMARKHCLSLIVLPLSTPEPLHSSTAVQLIQLNSMSQALQSLLPVHFVSNMPEKATGIS